MDFTIYTRYKNKNIFISTGHKQKFGIDFIQLTNQEFISINSNEIVEEITPVHKYLSIMMPFHLSCESLGLIYNLKLSNLSNFLIPKVNIKIDKSGEISITHTGHSTTINDANQHIKLSAKNSYVTDIQAISKDSIHLLKKDRYIILTCYLNDENKTLGHLMPIILDCKKSSLTIIDSPLYVNNNIRTVLKLLADYYGYNTIYLDMTDNYNIHWTSNGENLFGACVTMTYYFIYHINRGCHPFAVSKFLSSLSKDEKEQEYSKFLLKLLKIT